jgi:hypothetical protein
MTVYVDNARIPARVGRINARWSHLFADTQDELHAFAASIGLKRTWFQPGTPIDGKPSRHWHYDVTDAKRAAAINAGAQPVSIRDYRVIINARDRLTRIPEGQWACQLCGAAYFGACPDEDGLCETCRALVDEPVCDHCGRADCECWKLDSTGPATTREIPAYEWEW